MAVPLGSALATDWTNHNRSIGLQAVALHQEYRETDTQGLAADGTLNNHLFQAWQYRVQSISY